MLYVLPKRAINSHQLVNMSHINTHFDMFFFKWRYVWVSYISWDVYMLGSMTLTSWPTFTQTVGKKTQTTFLPYFMTAWYVFSAWYVFFYQKVCVFLAMVFIVFFVTTLCFYDFCKTVLQCWWENTHLAKVWFDFPLQNAIIVDWLYN